MIRLKTIGLLFIWILLMTSCGPTIHYLGEEYQRTRSVEVYYDENRIDEPYTVIGRMTNDQDKDYEPDQIRERMIREAKKVGADALVFTDLEVARFNRQKNERLVVKAKLLKFR